MRRPSRRGSTVPGMGDRVWFALGCAVIGAFWGAVAALAWMFLGHPFSAGPVVVMGSACALLGLSMGAAFADLLAAPLVLAWGFLTGSADLARPSDDDSGHWSAWLKMVFWAGFVLGVLYWLGVFGA